MLNQLFFKNVNKPKYNAKIATVKDILLNKILYIYCTYIYSTIEYQCLWCERQPTVMRVLKRSDKIYTLTEELIKITLLYKNENLRHENQF